MNVRFTEKQEQYISQLSRGDYQNASEVISEAMCLHELSRNKVSKESRAEIAKGWNCPSSEHSIREIVKTKTKVYKPE